MPEITADQLATTLLQRREIDTALFRFDPACDIRLEYSDWNHILHCLREHEERAAEPNCALCGDSGWVWSETRAGKIYAGKRCEVCAKAAVEKAVRP